MDPATVNAGDRLRWFDPAPVHRGEPSFLHVVRVADEPCSWRANVIERHWYTAQGYMVTEGFIRHIPDDAERIDPGTLADDYVCGECGGWFNPRYWLGGKKYASARLCLTCNHWVEAIGRVASGVSLVIGGGVWTIKPDLPKSQDSVAGCGGARFDIRMPDGFVRITRNLWFSGDVPSEFRARLPDNAAFISGAR